MRDCYKKLCDEYSQKVKYPEYGEWCKESIFKAIKEYGVTLKEELEKNGDRTLQVYAFFSLSTGARVTAVSSIRWEQIDFEKRCVNHVKEKFSNY